MRLMLFLVFVCSSVFGTTDTRYEIISEDRVTSVLKIYKINYEGHSYILFSNMWDHAGDQYFHDPECQKCKEKILVGDMK